MRNKKTKNFFRKLLNYIVFIVVSIFLVNGVMDFTYATNQVPNVVIDINKVNGEIQITQKGDLYGNDLWYPGKEVSGIIRINNNNVSPCVIESLGCKVTANVESFKNNMKLTIEKGSLLNFGDEPLVDKENLANLCDNGIKLQDQEQFVVTKSNPVDLKYTLLMDMNSGNELEDVTASIDFLINFSGDEVANDRSSNNHHNNNNSAEPDTEVIPLLPIVIEKVGMNEERFLKIEFPLPKEDDTKITKERNVGLKIIKMVEDKEQVIASCRLAEGNNSLNLNETNYLVNFNVKDQQFEPNVTYTSYVYDIDTGEKLLEPVNFIVNTESVNQLFNKQI